MQNSMTVRVQRAGVYNGPGHRSLPAAAEGDVIEVAGGAYGQSLIADGLVAAIGTEETPVEAEAADLASMRVAELREMAAGLGIEPLPGRKADLIEAIEAMG